MLRSTASALTEVREAVWAKRWQRDAADSIALGAATDCRALAGVGSSAGVRNGVRRIFRVPQRASPMPSR